MMCYKDQSWCFWSRMCGNDSCPRKFTQQHHEDAIKWWGDANYPLMLADLKTDDCGAKLI